MKLYHGGVIEIETPKILDNQRLVDFGKGFYTTTVLEQAQKWALIKKNREAAKEAFVSEFEINDAVFENKKYKILDFKVADEQWLDFVIKNRKEYYLHGYDIVKGAVANDTLYTVIRLFETGILNKSETISRLKVHKLFDQISFHNTEILKELKLTKTHLII
ncbi:DUF3990 domain-containing protein [Kaistella sp.]|uniref:DUF3990 domain-containing protein n=1 Tax=Kaistella sp. TaxID=2782235 RepID=UPI003C6730EF